MSSSSSSSAPFLFYATNMATCFIKTASTSNSSRFASHYLYMNTALFHSTPVWERRRGTYWTSGGGSYRGSSKRSYNFSRRSKNMHGKHTLLRNIDDFAECLFQSWGTDDPFSSKGSSSFRGQDWYKGKRGSNSGSQGTQWGNYRSREGGFHFCYGDEEDVEDIFRSAFVGDGYTYWSSFTIDDSSHWSSSYSTNHKKSRNQRSRYEDEYDTYEDYNCDSESDSSADRLALGLSASGPLKLDDIKNAYRACALKYHPDRHQGSSKANAEEKFKHCSAAYQSLCDKLE